MTDDLPASDRIAGVPHPRETEILFGQDSAQAEFLQAFTAGRVHSGWLITGPRGVGKATLAWKIATFLLATPAQQDDGLFGAPPPPTTLSIDPEHPDARLVQSGSHPGLLVIKRMVNEKTGALQSEITREALDPLKNFFHMSATDGGHRVAIVDAADEMNRNAANAILKELEEPPANTTFLLIAHQPSRLLPTIRSRCRTLRCAALNPADLSAAIEQAGLNSERTDALTTLSGGSAGDAIRLLSQDGLTLYAELVDLLSGLPNINRPALLKLADSCAGRNAETRFSMTLDLLDHLLSRAARAGLMGEPQSQGAPGEARLLARISPDDRAARQWAQLQQDLSRRARHGRAVNLDPAALILDMVFAIEQTAQTHAAT